MTDPATIGSMIAASCRLGLGYADRLLTEITAEQFGQFAAVGDQTIESNHPAFIFGHLSIYPCRVVADLGVDATSITPSDEFLRLFNKDATCQNDLDGSIYPGKDEIVAAFRAAHEQAIAALESAEDAVFQTPNANEVMRAKFPTTGAMHAFYLGGHFMVHMGQLSAWRRMMGLGAA
ncbi:MAG: DinB family protein [Planctomycetota bacterium]